MLSAIDAGQGDRMVGKVGRGDDHGVDVLVARDFFVLRCVLGRSPFVLALVQQLFVRIAYRRQFAARIEFDPWHMMEIRHKSSADDRDSYLIVGHLCLS
jgi:hypothetical protein